MFLGLLALCIVTIRVFPKTPAAQWLNDNLVARPLAWISSLKRHDIILLFVLVVLFSTAGEFIVVFGAGELFALAVNLSLYFDALLVTIVTAIATTVATGWRTGLELSARRFRRLAVYFLRSGNKKR